MSEEIPEEQPHPSEMPISPVEPLQAFKVEDKPPLTIKRKLVYISIILVLVIMGFIIVMANLINVNSQCTSNPFVYGASKIETARGDANVFCSCTTDDGTFCTCSMINDGKFWFDDEKVYAKNPFLF